MPYPNEHAARLQDPGRFDDDSFRRKAGSGAGTVQGVKVPTSIIVLYAKFKGRAAPDDPVIPQALRFPLQRWTSAQARKWLSDNGIKYKLFEVATNE